MLNPEAGIYRVGLFDSDFEIGYNSAAAKNLLDFLFQDLPPTGGTVADRRFDVVMVGNPVQMSLWLDEKRYYHGTSRHELASILVNEIIYSCIFGNCRDHAIHAAAVSVGSRGLLFPGTSGSGKSSLAAWLIANGCNYLTDELAMVTADGIIQPFTRPLCLKLPSFQILAQHFPFREEDILHGAGGAMIPHRCLNQQWQPQSATVDAIIFPRYVKDHPGALTPISSAQSCLKIIGCFVNARNMADHGIHHIAGLARQVASYELQFGSYEAILPALQPLLAGTR